MIFTERTIMVVNDSATINKPLILYRGDKNIELKITIAESQFKFRSTGASNVIETANASYAQLVINTPYNSPIFSEVTATENGTVIFVISAAMIDEIREVGIYDIQIRLLDDNKQSRVTIPPVSNAIEIREPMAIEDGSVVDSNVVNVAKVNRALTTTSAPLEAFDSQGNYIKKTWGDGDPITDAALNKMEAGIDGVNKKIANASSQIKEKVNISTFNSKVWSMSNMGQDVKEAITGGSVPVVGKDSILEENIVDRQVTRGKTTCFSVWQDGNLLSKEINIKQYGYIYINNGNKNNTDAYTLKLSLEDIDFINIPLRFNFTSHITYWDENDTFISGYIQGALDDGVHSELLKDIPSNAKYVKMSLWVDRINNAIIAKETSYDKDLKTKYVDNSLRIIQDNLDANFKFKKTSIQEVELYPYGNLFEKDKLISGKYWDTNGNLVTNSTVSTFTFEIDPTQQYRFNFTSHITFWDENDTFISGYIQGALDDGENSELLKDIPSNAKYVKMLVYNSRINDAIFSLDIAYAKDLRCVYYMKDFIADGENLNNTQNKNPLYGKKAIFFGDSWCAGNTSQPGGWASWIKSNNPSMTITNCGIYGSDWFQCYNTWFNDEANYNSLDDEADYIIIEAYTNGLYVDVDQVAKPLGEVDEFTYYNSVDEIIALGNTYAVDLEKVLYSIVTKWNGKKIGLMFPYKSADMLRQNNAFRQFREQVFKCCRKYNIPVFDNFNGCNIPSWTQEYIDKYFFHGDDNQEHADGVHLNATGYDIICPPIENWLKTL